MWICWGTTAEIKWPCNRLNTDARLADGWEHERTQRAFFSASRKKSVTVCILQRQPAKNNIRLSLHDLSSWPPVNQTDTHHTSSDSPLADVCLRVVLAKTSPPPVCVPQVCNGRAGGSSMRHCCCLKPATGQREVLSESWLLFSVYMHRPSNSTPSRGGEQRWFHL